MFNEEYREINFAFCMGIKIFNLYKKFAGFLARINTRIILTVFYFAVIPIFKLLSLLIKERGATNTNWKTKDKPYPDSHEHSF